MGQTPVSQDGTVVGFDEGLTSTTQESQQPKLSQDESEMTGAWATQTPGLHLPQSTSASCRLLSTEPHPMTYMWELRCH